MLTSYFGFLNYSKSVINDFFIVEGGNDLYYVCEYKNRGKGKMEIIDSLRLLPAYRHFSTGDFDFHHVVEEQHLSDISFSNKLYFNYGNMPTVLIHKGEHKRYNAILHARETRNLYLRDKEKFTSQKLSSNARKQATIELFNKDSIEGLSEVSNRIMILKDIYRNVYEGNRVLKIIANNIFHEYQKQLKV